MSAFDGIDPYVAAAHQQEMAAGRRFGFGRNWRNFAQHVDADAIAQAEESLLGLLSRAHVTHGALEGTTFLDAGCGSGLFTLAALRQGALVTAFDFDPDSVVATRTLLAAHHGGRGADAVLHGSVLDEQFLMGLGEFDVVYSWGVLHHTGAMWDACRNVARRVRSGGTLVVALYADVGPVSRLWWGIKRVYVGLPSFLQVPFAVLLLVPIEVVALVRSLVRFDPLNFVRRWTRYRSLRGMSRWHDHLDWIGGFPYEYSTREETIGFFVALGFEHERTVPAVAWGNNEFVFRRTGEVTSPAG
ncbi:MAG: class I SAM-dependent methyltransferase [Actinomycetota bacterium]|nr:class I SAM-dependent methyltransferase [Actinomycetota bacterium]